MKTIIIYGFLLSGFLLLSANGWRKYPIDGYETTGIRRLKRLELIQSGTLTGTKPIKGALKSIQDIKLNLTSTRGDSLIQLPAVDPGLQKSINTLFPNLDESYSLTLLDITPGRPVRYAKRQEQKGFQPGSVGKLVVISALFNELKKLYPGSFEQRTELLRTRQVKAGEWALPNEHTVPFFDPETNQYYTRTVQDQDIFSLYEWADHMLSVSSNAAASVVWREVILMRVFGERYPALTQEMAVAYFKETPKTQLIELSVSIINQPLRDIGISEDEWRLGSMFTAGAKKIIPGSGGSLASPYGMMKFMILLERGKVVDQASSLEIKRLMYMTGRRIRYAASASLTSAAVYFKSGSLYSCKPEEGYTCEKYMGNQKNFMNSVAIIEHQDGTIYLVALMSNVLKKNSSNDHYALASQIDTIVRKK